MAECSTPPISPSPGPAEFIDPTIVSFAAAAVFVVLSLLGLRHSRGAPGTDPVALAPVTAAAR